MFSSPVVALIKPFKTVIYALTLEARLFIIFQPPMTTVIKLSWMCWIIVMVCHYKQVILYKFSPPVTTLIKLFGVLFMH